MMKMSKVVSLHGGPVSPAGPGESPPSPDDDVVELLEDLLERAKAGYINNLAYAYTTGEAYSASGWVGAAKGTMVLGFSISMLHNDYYNGVKDG